MRTWVKLIVPRVQSQTYPSRTCSRKLVERLGQQDLRIANSLSNGIVFLLPSEGQLRERRLVTWRVLDVDEVLIVWDAVVLWQLKETYQGL